MARRTTKEEIKMCEAGGGEMKESLERRRVASMIMFSCGQFAAFDEHGQQIPELQIETAIGLWIKRASELGFTVSGCQVSTQGFSGTVRGSDVHLDKDQ